MMTSNISKKTFSENLRSYMQKKGVNQADIGRELGVKYSAVSTWYNGQRFPRLEALNALAGYFGVSISELLGERVGKKKNTFTINNAPLVPIIGEIACGKPIFALESYEEYACPGKNVGADFAVRAKGDSMQDIGIRTGDLVFIKSTPTVENGAIAAILIGEEVTLKRFYYYPEEEKVVLVPENASISPFVYTGEEINDIRILGRAVASLSIFDQ